MMTCSHTHTKKGAQGSGHPSLEKKMSVNGVVIPCFEVYLESITTGASCSASAAEFHLTNAVSSLEGEIHCRKKPLSIYSTLLQRSVEPLVSTGSGHTFRPTNVSRYEDDGYIPFLILTPLPANSVPHKIDAITATPQLPTFPAADVVAERTLFCGQSADGRSRLFAFWNFRSFHEDFGEEK
jgi:hypothetical protein